MIPEQPGDAIVRATALFICGERDDDVAIGLETLLLVLDQVGDPDSRLGLVVSGAAAIEETIALIQLEGIHAPVFSLGFDNINVGQQENRLECSSDVITDDQIGFLWICASQEDIGFGKAGGAQASRGGLGYRSCSAGGEPGGDFDKFLVNVMGKLPFHFGTCSLRANARGGKKRGED